MGTPGLPLPPPLLGAQAVSKGVSGLRSNLVYGPLCIHPSHQPPVSCVWCLNTLIVPSGVTCHFDKPCAMPPLGIWLHGAPCKLCLSNSSPGLSTERVLPVSSLCTPSPSPTAALTCLHSQGTGHSLPWSVLLYTWGSSSHGNGCPLKASLVQLTSMPQPQPALGTLQVLVNAYSVCVAGLGKCIFSVPLGSMTNPNLS